MIYNNIDISKISLGAPKNFTEDDDLKQITPLYYNGEEFTFALKNMYIKVEKIEENSFNKEYITIKSKTYANIVSSITEKLGVFNPIQTDGSFRANIVSKTKFDKEINKDKPFKACISLTFPTIFKDSKKTTLQIHLRDVIVTELINNELEIDYDKLEEAM